VCTGALVLFAPSCKESLPNDSASSQENSSEEEISVTKEEKARKAAEEKAELEAYEKAKEETYQKDKAAALERSKVRHSNAAVDAIRRHRGTARNSYDYYVKWVSDLKNGPTGKEKRISSGIRKINPSNTDLLDKVIEMSTYPSLKKVAADYKDSFAKLHPVVDEANRYYEQEDYKDDGGKKGREIHVKMMPLFEEHFKLEARYSEALDEVLDAAILARLDEDKKAGRVLAYDIKYTLIKLEKIVEFYKDKQLDDLKAEEVEAQYTEVSELYNSLKAHSDKSEEVKEEMESYLEAVDKCALPVKKLMRVVKAEEKLRNKEEHVRSLFNAYNQFVSNYNSVISNRVLMNQ